MSRGTVACWASSGFLRVRDRVRRAGRWAHLYRLGDARAAAAVSPGAGFRPAGHLSLADAAGRAGVSTTALRKLASLGRLRVTRVGRGKARYWVPESEADRVAAERARAAAARPDLTRTGTVADPIDECVRSPDVWTPGIRAELERRRAKFAGRAA